MELALFLVEIALAGALAAVFALEWARRRRRTWVDELAAKTIVVHRRDEDAIAGVLVTAYHDSIVLRHASLLVGNGERLPLAGDAVIPRATIVLVQHDEKLKNELAGPDEVVPVRVQ